MTDIRLKHRIVALTSFAFVALILTVRSAVPFTFVFFGCMGLVLFVADKFLNSEKIKERTLLAFFVFASCYQTFYQIFNRTHDDGKQIMVAVALSIFLVAVFSATDIKKLPLSIFSAPLLCFLDSRIAAAYSILLLSFSVMKFRLDVSGNKFRNKSVKKKANKNAKVTKEHKGPDPINVILISIITSTVCLVYCIFSVLNNDIRIVEKPDYLFAQFKNTFGFVVFIVYLLVKLIKSKLKVNAGIVVGLLLNLALTVLYTVNYGWSIFSLFLISAIMFLGLVCFESENVINSIKADFSNHRYIFIVGLLCLLQ